MQGLCVHMCPLKCFFPKVCQKPPTQRCRSGSKQRPQSSPGVWTAPGPPRGAFGPPSESVSPAPRQTCPLLPDFEMPLMPGSSSLRTSAGVGVPAPAREAPFSMCALSGVSTKPSSLQAASTSRRSNGVGVGR